MIDDNKIEEAKEEIYEDRFLLNGEEIVFDNDEKEEMFYKGDIKEAIGLGAKWAINEILKDLFHPSSEVPRNDNGKVLAFSKEYGYRIIYLLHPAMSSQAEDFDRNDYVELMEAAGDMSYEKILTESSLIVTDYSGVQFDFAYQRKPVVYYHPEVLPPSYEEGVYRYDKNGFGEICTKHDELIDTLCDYIRNECKIKPFYNDRANDFFAYDDFNSCERIYNEVKKYLARFN